jgi:hypothetical protein
MRMIIGRLCTQVMNFAGREDGDFIEVRRLLSKLIRRYSRNREVII